VRLTPRSISASGSQFITEKATKACSPKNAVTIHASGDAKTESRTAGAGPAVDDSGRPHASQPASATAPIVAQLASAGRQPPSPSASSGVNANPSVAPACSAAV
jgi:hypothetical protein